MRAITFPDVAYVIGGIIVGFILLSFTIAAISDMSPTLTVVFSAALLLGQNLLIAGVVYVLLVRWRKLPWSSMGFAKISKKWIAAAFVIALAMALASETIENYLEYPLNEIMNHIFAPEGFTWRGLFLMTAVVGLAAPLSEEILFRGILYTWIRSKWGITAGVIISSLLFGAVHLEPVLIAFAAGMGIILSLTYEYSRTLWAPIVVHMVNNTLAILWLYYNLA